jgi:type II secretory pathway predicted ATPase ExeA
MYEASFGLEKRPFASAPRADCYFPAATIEAARQSVTRCIQRAEGAALVVGPSGTGKTLLCQILGGHFAGDFDVVLLASGRLGNRRALVQAILHGLGKPWRGMDEEELRLALLDHLTDPGASTEGLLLLVDEAHTLALRCLDELRMTTNIAAGGQPRTRLVLVGAPLLEERLASPRLDSFSQRLAARCYLEPLNRAETEGYIHAQIAVAGGNAAMIFPPEACQAVYQATGGVPRLINQVCDHALLMASVAGRKRIETATVQEAWADLQQLPTPWNAESKKPEASGATIEFGSLDDESGEAVAGAPAGSAEEPPAAACGLPDEAPDDNEAATPEPVGQIGEIQQMLGQLEDDFRPVGTIRPEVDLVLDDPADPFSEPFDEEEVVVDRYTAALAQQNAQAVETAPPPRRNTARGLDQVMPETVPLRAKADVADLEPDEPELVVEDDYDFVEPPETHPVTPVRRHEYRQLFARLRRA